MWIPVRVEPYLDGQAMPQIAMKEILPSTDVRSLHARYPGFRGGICRHPIRYRHRWHRDLLLQAALDPAVDAMDPVEIEVPGCLAFVVQKGARRMLVVGVDDTTIKPVIECDLQIVHVARATVLSEPIASDARAVWATRHQIVAASDRVRILAAFEQVEQRTLSHLAACVRAPADGVDAILGMACLGELALAISDGIRPETRVWRRRSRDPSEVQERLSPGSRFL